jgi:hypothetical protein
VGEKVQHKKDTSFPKLIYRLNAILIKTLAQSFVDINKLSLNFIFNGKTILKKKNSWRK